MFWEVLWGLKRPSFAGLADAKEGRTPHPALCCVSFLCTCVFVLPKRVPVPCLVLLLPEPGALSLCVPETLDVVARRSR